ncbi:imm11 family protein [Amycolatopsis sp. NPDC059657]|uniref:imm11 family protein n=1 Tax=Amycolatopsis sp. NPDC059657 TaxID=3346899 RepID=UPI00366C7A12
MKVYEPTASPGYEWVIPLDPAAFDRLHAKPWRPFEVRFLTEDAGTKLQRADLPWLAHGVLVLRPRAAQLIGGLLEPYGELLPLPCADEELVLFRTTRLVDALDEAASTFIPFADGGIMAIADHRFRDDLAHGVFALPQLPTDSIYFDEDTVRAVTKAGLSGTGFQLVYDSAAPPAPGGKPPHWPA